MKDPLPWPDKPANWQEKTGGYAKDMTLRDYFAAKCMQGTLSNPNLKGTADDVAKVAYAMADAMIKAGQ